MTKAEVIDALERNVGRMLEENARLTEACREAAGRCSQMEREISELRAQNASLSARLAKMELGHGFLADDGDKRRVRQRITSLMRDLDKCMALLND